MANGVVPLRQKSNFAIFSSEFFTATIFLTSCFRFTSFCLWRLELSQSTLIHSPRSKFDNGYIVVFRKNDMSHKILQHIVKLFPCTLARKMAATENTRTHTSKAQLDTQLDSVTAHYF